MRKTPGRTRHLISLLILTGSITCLTVNANAAESAIPVIDTPAAASSGVNKTGVSAANYDLMKKNMETAGFSFTQTGTSLDIVLDEATFLAVVPALVKEKAIIKVDENDLKMAPMTVSVYAAGVPFSVTILSGVYAKFPALDKLHVSLFVVPTGSKDKQLCFSFDYTRSLYNALDMNKTTSNDFMTKTPAFAFTDWCKGLLDGEQKAAAPAPAGTPATTTKP